MAVADDRAAVPGKAASEMAIDLPEPLKRLNLNYSDDYVAGQKRKEHAGALNRD